MFCFLPVPVNMKILIDHITDKISDISRSSTGAAATLPESRGLTSPISGLLLFLPLSTSTSLAFYQPLTFDLRGVLGFHPQL